MQLKNTPPTAHRPTPNPLALLAVMSPKTIVHFPPTISQTWHKKSLQLRQMQHLDQTKASHSHRIINFRFVSSFCCRPCLVRIHWDGPSTFHSGVTYVVKRSKRLVSSTASVVYGYLAFGKLDLRDSKRELLIIRWVSEMKSGKSSLELTSVRASCSRSHTESFYCDIRSNAVDATLGLSRGSTLLCR